MVRLSRILLALVLCVCVVGVAEAKKKISLRSHHYSDKMFNASWYNCCGHTASGEPLNSALFTVAHKTLPFGTRVLLTNTANGISVCARVNDRGPFVYGRIWDTTKAIAVRLRF